jgi:hypothetical protein
MPLRTREELQRGVVDVCYVADQLALVFPWHFDIRPKLLNMGIAEDKLFGLNHAVLESSLLSLRLLDEFFWDGIQDPNDRRMARKHDDISAWQYPNSIGYETFLKRAERESINKYLTHMTTLRAKEQDWWPLLSQKVPIALTQVEKFLGYIVGSGVTYLPTDRTIEDISERQQVFDYVRNIIKNSR